ncbi:proteasome maturation factor UMP1 [Dacryopinax primogenitus]|uniref:Proteasome maturation factor UMP1 n=1 Tax=Dacryopinax primogenitus (strain DJM 731) TaxID=1858805 RepID=M5GB28_DACPD|nr:proteasome maturation factor UMP1 [Dacryopinax primogenitus]EJU03192.1 proteasome maturation factor UMP1 [Dacryopinax primogenitus]
MDNTYRIVPASNAGSSTASLKDTANEYGLHDTMRYGMRSLAAEIKQVAPLQGRLENWEETQDNLKLNMQRNLYGLHAPVRLLMERRAVSQTPHMPALPRSNVHLDILMGRDEVLDPAEIMDGAEGAEAMDIHGEMEKKLKL